MFLDRYGLPTQQDGDANDQLQRCGMIATARFLRDGKCDPVSSTTNLFCEVALDSLLQPTPGVYTRYVGGATDTVSADQLITALGAHIVSNNRKQVWLMFKACIKRLGFAQNTKDGLDAANSRPKIADFMLLRALPLFTRAHWSLYPLCLVGDLALVLAALSACGPVFRDGSIVPHKRSPDDVDDNNTILTLAVCSARLPTPMSRLATWLFSKLRPWNLGCVETTGTLVNNKAYSPVYGALRHYHRAESGGNPEIAEMWRPVIDKYFGGS